ncbi:hypothetical protein DFH06DRAFT_1238973 [Mycena polygramma]|nr:hypothetical protein DFH06DRAFT_1238973 [Mycena polygramma]
MSGPGLVMPKERKGAARRNLGTWKSTRFLRCSSRSGCRATKSRNAVSTSGSNGNACEEPAISHRRTLTSILRIRWRLSTSAGRRSSTFRRVIWQMRCGDSCRKATADFAAFESGDSQHLTMREQKRIRWLELRSTGATREQAWSDSMSVASSSTMASTSSSGTSMKPMRDEQR